MAKAVLIVDDNALIRQALCEMFKREADFEVCGEAENGQEAIEKAQQLHPDLIVMDLSMPVMNGIEAASVLKSLMPTVPSSRHDWRCGPSWAMWTKSCSPISTAKLELVANISWS